LSHQIELADAEEKKPLNTALIKSVDAMSSSFIPPPKDRKGSESKLNVLSNHWN
jgi:hypothetical protein